MPFTPLFQRVDDLIIADITPCPVEIDQVEFVHAGNGAGNYLIGGFGCPVKSGSGSYGNGYNYSLGKRCLTDSTATVMVIPEARPSSTIIAVLPVRRGGMVSPL